MIIKTRETSKEIGIITIFSIITVMTIIAINVMSLYNVTTLHNTTESIYNHPLKVSNAALNVQKGVIKIHRDMKDVVLFSSDDNLKTILQKIDEEEKNVYTYLQVIELNILGEQGLNLHHDTYKLFKEWKSIRENVIHLVKNKNLSDAIKITKESGAKHVRKLESSAINLNKYAYSKADEFKSESNLIFENSISNNIILTIFTAICFIIFTYYIRKRITNYIKVISEKDQLMIAQSRHAAMGEMIGMIAHQWRQPLSVISMGANNIIADIDLEEITTENLHAHSKSILVQTEHLTKTIDDFKNFFSPSQKKENIKILSVIEETNSIIGTSLSNSSINLNISCHSDLHVSIHKRELIQVILNLINNSKDAIVTKKIENGHIYIEVSEEDNWVLLKVSDNGGGIKNDSIGKIFDPYFTTKGVSSGTGLGLYISKTIIETHLHGSIQVYNTDGGACFEIRIPKVQEVSQ